MGLQLDLELEKFIVSRFFGRAYKRERERERADQNILSFHVIAGVK